MVKPKNELSPEARKKLIALMARDIPRIEQTTKKDTA